MVGEAEGLPPLRPVGGKEGEGEVGGGPPLLGQDGGELLGVPLHPPPEKPSQGQYHEEPEPPPHAGLTPLASSGLAAGQRM